MDIEQLITSINKLEQTDRELEKKIDSKKRALDKVNSEILKEKQRLEEKVEQLVKAVENKIKESQLIDRSLSSQSSILSMMQKTREMHMESVEPELNKNDTEVQTNLLDRAQLQQTENDNSNLKTTTSEDLLKAQFQKEFQIEYPTTTARYLDHRSFKQIISILRDKIFHSNNPDKIVDEYLEIYGESVNDEQTEQLLELKNQFHRL